MKFITGWSAVAFAFTCFSIHAQTVTPVCSTPFCTVSAAHVTDAGGKPVTGTIVFQSTDGAGSPLNLTIAGGGQAVPTQVTAPITAGAFSLSLADTTQTTPKNACYRAYMTNSNGRVILGSNIVDPSAPLQCVQMNAAWCTGAGCTFDTYPTNAGLWTVYPNVASALTLGGVLVPSSSGLTIDGAGHLGVDWNQSPVSSVNGQTGAITLDIPTDTSQLANGAGFVTAQQAANAAPVQSIQINGITQSPSQLGVINLPIPTDLIRSVQVNGVTQTPANGAVNVVVPVNTNQLVNGAGFITSAQVSANVAGVKSVAGKSGVVTLTTADINGLGTAATMAAGAFDPANAAASAVASIPTASASNAGLLKASDWSAFNAKQPALGFVPANPANALSEYSVADVLSTLGIQSAALQPASAFDPAGAANTAMNSAISIAAANTASAIAAIPAGSGGSGSSPIQSIKLNGTTQAPVSGVVSLTVPAQVNSDWNASSGPGAILNKPSIPANTNQLVNGAGFVTSAQAASAAPVQSVASRTGAVTLTHNDITDWSSATSGLGNTVTAPIQSITVNGSAQTPVSGNVALTIPAAQVQSDWNAITGAAQILNKPTIPAAQVASDWNAASGVAQILNKPTIPVNTSQLTNGAGFVTSAQAASAAPVQSVASRTGAVTLTHNDITDWATITSGFSSGGGSMARGTLASIPSTCAAGDAYVATNQAAGQQLYLCSATNTWTQQVNVGSSGALAVTNGSLDITSQVPLKGVTNTWTGSNTHNGTETFTGNVNFTGATVTGLSSGSNVSVTSPYLTINGVNYLPMANMFQPTLLNLTGWSQNTTTQYSAAVSVTNTGAGANAPILTAGATGAWYMHPFASGKKKMYVAMTAGLGTYPSRAGIAFTSATGGNNSGISCGAEIARGGSYQNTYVECDWWNNGTIANTWTAGFGVDPGELWMGFDFTSATNPQFVVSLDHGRTWTTVQWFDLSSGGLGAIPANYVGFWMDPSVSLQILHESEQ